MPDMNYFITDCGKSERQTLEDFVKFCRYKLMVFGADLDWDASTWRGVCNFTKWGAPAKGYLDSQILNANILEFAKSYVRYQQGHNPTVTKREIVAVRCIEKALIASKGIADITLVDGVVMDVAASVASEYRAIAYQAGRELKKLANFLNQSGIVRVPIDWTPAFKKPIESNRTDSNGKKRRGEKLPKESILNAMAEMFSNDLVNERDRYTTSIFALLMCAPSRITEVQQLPLNCLHVEARISGPSALGLRLYAGKGFGAGIKWIPAVMGEIAKEAVRRLSELSSEGRRLAKWYEDFPSRFYRHSECPDVSEHAPLTIRQACMALGIGCPNRSSLDRYFKGYAPYSDLRKNRIPLSLAFLNVYCHDQLPPDWPWLSRDRKVKYSNALCCLRMNELRADVMTSKVKLWVPARVSFAWDLGGCSDGRINIWQRHGYRNSDGSRISLSSHQIRHFLNTLAQRGDLGQLDIAKWSGRINVQQNQVYNHMVDEEYVEMARSVGVGSGCDLVNNTPVDYSAIKNVNEGIAHVTEYGFCVHDFSMVPCQRYRDCLNCTEHVCIKGDGGKISRLKKRRELIAFQLSKAIDADSLQIYGADRWRDHQEKTLGRIDRLISLLTCSELADGSCIRLGCDREATIVERDSNRNFIDFVN